MENMAILIIKFSDFFIDRRRSFGLTFGRPMEKKTQNNSNQSWTRGTYYFPSNNMKRNSLVPSNLDEMIVPHVTDEANKVSDTAVNIIGEVDKND